MGYFKNVRKKHASKNYDQCKKNYLSVMKFHEIFVTKTGNE